MSSKFKLTAKQLGELGFERDFVTAEESGSDKDFIYYTYTNSGLDFITSAVDDGDEELFEVTFFDCEDSVLLTYEFLSYVISYVKNTEPSAALDHDE